MEKTVTLRGSRILKKNSILVTANSGSSEEKNVFKVRSPLFGSTATWDSG